MGMFDSMYDDQNNEWQTKAFGRQLDRFHVGDAVPHPSGIAWPAPPAYQISVFGGAPVHEAQKDGYATIRKGDLAAVPDERDDSLPLIDYHGGWAAEPKEN